MKFSFFYMAITFFVASMQYTFATKFNSKYRFDTSLFTKDYSHFAESLVNNHGNNLSLKTYIIINIIYSEYKKTNDHLYSIDKLDQESKSINLDFESLLKIGQDQKSFLMLKDSETLQNKATSPTKNLKHK